MKPVFIVVTGPPASGKTLNAKAIQEHFNAAFIYEDGILFNHCPELKFNSGRILIVILNNWKVSKLRHPFNHDRKLRPIRCYSIQKVKAILGDKWIEPVDGYVASAN